MDYNSLRKVKVPARMKKVSFLVASSAAIGRGKVVIVDAPLFYFCGNLQQRSLVIMTV